VYQNVQSSFGSTVHYTVELRQRGHEHRPQRIAGLGSFDDLRQLMLRGVR
jgi:hypothetical protein